MTVRGVAWQPRVGMRGGVAVAAAALGLAIAGCTTPQAGSADARTRLLAAAAAEGPPGELPIAAEMPPPANLVGVDLEPRAADDPRAWDSLEDAIATARAAHPEIVAPAPVEASGPGDDGDADEALRAYLRGRNAMLAGDFPQAVGEFERAHVLDPGEASILRQLGRAYSQAGNGPRAAEAFGRLRGLEPDDAEALFTVGMNAVNRGRHAEAVAALSRLREVFADSGGGDANAATTVSVDFALANALLELGHDRAFLAMAEAALDHPIDELAARGDDPRVGEIYRRRSELAQAMGDAMLRLGDADAAVERYRAAAELPVADPAALRSRLVHGLLRAGRPLAAQAEFLAACESGAAGDAEVALAGHLLESGVDVAPLVAAVEALGRQRPNEPEIVRVLARLDPEATVRILTELAAESADADGVEQLLDWVERVDLGSACAIAVDLAQRNPEAIAPAAARLAASSGTPRELRDHLAALPPSAARTAIEAALLVALRDPASAWGRLDETPDPSFDLAGLRARTLAAGALADATLVAEVERRLAAAIERGELAGSDAIDAEAAVIEAHLAADASEAAWRMIEARPIDPAWPAARRSSWLLLQSRAAAAERSTAVGAAAKLLESVAVRSADAAIAADPGSVEAWEWALALRDPRSGLAPDAEAHRRTLESMQSALAGEAIVERLRAEQDLMRGRVDAAITRLETVLAAHPGDAAALEALVGTLTRAGRVAEIAPRLDRRVAEAPSEPVGWEMRVATLARGGRAAEAETELRALLESDPEHPFANGLLEALLRATGRGDEAETLASARLARRPETPGRAIAQAMLQLERSGRLAEAARVQGTDAAADEVVGASAEAVASAAALLESVPAMSRAERVRLLSIPLQASPDVRGRREAIETLAEAILAADAEAPLAVHGAALLAASLEDPLDRDREAFAGLVRRAVGSPAARATDDAAAVRWLGIAERMMDAGEPAAAAAVLREVALGIPWPAGEARRTLRAATIALLARAGGRADETVAFVEALRDGDGFAAGEGLMPAAEATDEPNPLLDASSIHSIVGDRAGAETLLEAVLAENPDEAMALNNLAYARLEDGFLDAETRGMLERAFELRPSDTHILDSLGWLRYREGMLEDDGEGDDRVFGAVSLLGEAVRLGGTDPSLEGLDHLGDALWRADRRDEAEDAWRRALEIGLRRFEREGTVRGIEGFQRGAFGMVVRDPAAFYEESYGEPIERVRAKLRAVRDGRPPEIADSAADREE